MTYQAGCISLQVPDQAKDLAFPLYLFCPTQAAGTPAGTWCWALPLRKSISRYHGGTRGLIGRLFYAARFQLNPFNHKRDLKHEHHRILRSRERDHHQQD